MTMEHIGMHPAIVHFPIVLLVAALVLDAAGMIGARRRFTVTGRWALCLGTVSAGLAVWSGHHEGDAVRAALAPSVEALMLRHHDLALWTLGGAVVLSVWRLVVRDDAALKWQLAYLFLATALITQLSRTAHLGGRLVFEHAVGVHMG